jgi:glucose-6-phosphate 1-epimerase
VPPVLALRSADGATAEIHHDGAQVTSWRPAGGEERLFLSATTALREGVAIRGGIPVIFPQFAAEGPLPRHGFARTMRWTLTGETQAPDGTAHASFALSDTDATRAIWPAVFRATLAVRVGGPELGVSLTIENRGEAPFYFAAALHTYLRVRDVTRTSLEGLHGVRFRESGYPGELRTDDATILRPEGEIDRVYVAVPGPVVVREPTRALEVASSGFADVVVWNPGAEKAAALADLERDGERRMLCVESAAVQQRPMLAPRERWTGEQRLTDITPQRERP